MPIKYNTGYKYQLVEDYQFSLVDVDPEHKDVWLKLRILTDYVNIYKGVMTIYHGYAWDGPSGPAIDTHNFMRGSLIHDALYQLIREKQLPEDVYRIHADEILKRVCIEDGMSKIRAWWVYYGVRFGGYLAASKIKPVYISP